MKFDGFSEVLRHFIQRPALAAILYYQRFAQEVDAEIADNRAAHAEGRALRDATGRRA